MRPAPRALWLAGGWLALALAAAFAPAVVPVWAGAGALLGAALAGDAFAVWRAGPFTAEREVPASLAVGAWSRVLLRVRNAGARAASLALHDHHPSSMAVRNLPFDLDVEPGGFAELSYRIYPSERGELAFGHADLLIGSPLGLWQRRIRAGQPESVRVFPNFRNVMKYSLLATEHRTAALGIRRRPRRGEGLDFLQLREYRAGDALRQIDWKVTARMQKTISREYQDERDQQIVFLLDCGRKLHSRDDALSHFDHALNAVLLLAHVALRQGDAVGLLTFSGPHRWLAPRKGAAHLNAILQSVYDLSTSPRASDYLRAAQDLFVRLKKRALVVVVSNLRDEDHDELALAARLLGDHHLVLVASMKEQALARALESPVLDVESALRVSATHQYLEARRVAHERLRRGGVLALDAEPQELPVALVNGYLDVKSRGLL